MRLLARLHHAPVALRQRTRLLEQRRVLLRHLRHLPVLPPPARPGCPASAAYRETLKLGETRDP
jgi:hypothetical protein